MKMNKLIGLAMTWADDASSENEFITAGRLGRNMIIKELNCSQWVASRIMGIISGNEEWFPCPERMHIYGTLPRNASDIFAKALKDLGIRYNIKTWNNGVSYNKI